jgi:hypothetical protein
MNHRAIYNTHPKVVSVDETLGAFDKDGNNVVLDQDKVDVETAKLKAELDAQEYARNRKIEYDFLNQFELMTDDAANGTTTHAEAIAAIKTKYPKG